MSLLGVGSKGAGLPWTVRSEVVRWRHWGADRNATLVWRRSGSWKARDRMVMRWWLMLLPPSVENWEHGSRLRGLGDALVGVTSVNVLSTGNAPLFPPGRQ